MNQISDKATLMPGVILGDDVIIEEDVYIDYYCIIRDHVRIGRGSYIGARCILGEYLADFVNRRERNPHPLTIGEGAVIRSETIIYGDTVIGARFQTGHRVTIRENTVIGDDVRIGTLSDVQGHCTIDDHASLHSKVFVAPNAHIGKYAWLSPCATLTNDPTPPSEVEQGVVLEAFSTVAAGAIVLPGVRVHTDGIVAAGAIATRDVPPGRIVVGNPARDRGDVTQIKNRDTGEQAYPWRHHFDRGMPWHGIGYAAWRSENDLDLPE